MYVRVYTTKRGKIANIFILPTKDFDKVAIQPWNWTFRKKGDEKEIEVSKKKFRR